MKGLLFVLSLFVSAFQITEVNAQQVKIYPQNILGHVSNLYKPGINLTPKTVNGQNDFVNSGLNYSTIRYYDIEFALQYASPSIAGVMAQLELYKPGIMYVNARCNQLILPITRMPLWLSSSTDTTMLGDPNWRKYNAVPPANYALWSLLVDSIVAKISGQWGLNPIYEVWNEPDNFYWQGTPSQYFNFFKKTYFAIKTNHPAAKIGGPALSSFTSMFGTAYPIGYITNTQLDASIIGRLIDSCVVWNAKLDFISWHKFDSFLHSVKMEIDYLNQKLVNAGHGIVPYVISEWNNTYQIRESNFAAAFMSNYILAIEKNGVNCQSVASSQDFDMDTLEFHHDYGMLSWGALHKPEWKALLLLNKIRGVKIKTDSSNFLNLAVTSSVINDTLRVLFSNRSIPAFTEATSYILYDKYFNVNDISVAGYTYSKLDSIYKGLIMIPGVDALSLAIKSAIPIYEKADAAFRFGRNINMIVSGIKGTHSGKVYMIDSTNNNVIHQYDSLLNAGYSRALATARLYPNEAISNNNFTMVDSQYSFHLQPNAVALFEVYIPNISVVANPVQSLPDFKLFPNPTSKSIRIEFSSQLMKDENINIINSIGVLVKTVVAKQSTTVIDVSKLASGIYFIQLKNYPKQILKFVKR